MTVTGFQLVRADIQGAVLNNAERTSRLASNLILAFVFTLPNVENPDEQK